MGTKLLQKKCYSFLCRLELGVIILQFLLLEVVLLFSERERVCLVCLNVSHFKNTVSSRFRRNVQYASLKGKGESPVAKEKMAAKERFVLSLGLLYTANNCCITSCHLINSHQYQFVSSGLPWHATSIFTC